MNESQAGPSQYPFLAICPPAPPGHIPTSIKCAICHIEDFKYTCPKCSVQTCSSICSKSHKEKFKCDGQRDPGKFLSLKEYSQGNWGDDYAYLEESRRKILHWGEGLPPLPIPGRGRGGSGTGVRGGGGDRGGRGGQNHLSNAERKVQSWKREMQKRGCWVEVMPEGMSRRKMNLSSWNPKNQSINLTIHIQIPHDLFDPPLGTTLETIQHPRVPFSTSTLASLLPPNLSVPSNQLVFLLPFHPSPSRPTPPITRTPRPKLFYTPLDPSLTLEESLRGTAWIEFPVVQIMKSHVWIIMKAKGDFQVVDKAVVESPSSTVPNPQAKKRLVEEVGKRPREDVEEAGVTGIAVLGDYGSDEEISEGELDLDDEDIQDDVMEGEQEEEEGGDEGDVADVLGAIDLPGGPEMMAKVSEALLADFGVTSDDEEMHEGDEVLMTEVETRR